MNINIEKWKSFIDDGVEYSIDAGFRHDLDSFIQEIEESNNLLDWEAFPLSEIISRKWIKSNLRDLKKYPQKVFDEFLELVGTEEIPQKVLLRKTLHKNTKSLMNDYALLAWSIRVLNRGVNSCCPNKYNPEIMSNDFLREVAQFSRFDDGPLKIRDFLADHGIALVAEKPLTGSKFNGASLMSKSGAPIIGLTLSYDRLDNFWFTLLHELAHVWKHLHSDDDLYIDFFSHREEDKIDSPEEQEANKIAREVLIPLEYTTHDAFIIRSEQAVLDLANELNIHPSIIAGRIRHDNDSWYILSNLVNKESVRNFFENSGWN